MLVHRLRRWSNIETNIGWMSRVCRVPRHAKPPINSHSAEICLYKPWRLNGFYKVSFFRLIWILMSLVYGHYNFFNSSGVEMTLDDVYWRQILFYRSMCMNKDKYNEINRCNNKSVFEFKQIWEINLYIYCIEWDNVKICYQIVQQ